MPVLEIEIVDHAQASIPAGLADRLADAAGTVLGSRTGGTWVRLRLLPDTAYAENGAGPPDGVAPVFVSVLKGGLDDGVDPDEVRALTAAIAATCDRPRNHVHVRYEPEGRGRQAFGGVLVD